MDTEQIAPSPKPPFKKWAAALLLFAALLLLPILAGGKDYGWKLISWSFTDSWMLVVEKGWASLAVFALSWGVSFYLENRSKERQRVMEEVTKAFRALKLPFGLVLGLFLLHVLIITPAKMNSVSNPGAEQSPIKLDTADYSLREDFKKSTNEVMELQKKLEASNAKLKEMDPKRQNLASARMSAEVTVRTDKDVGRTTTMTPCGYVAIVNGTNVLVWGGFRPCESVPAVGGGFRFTSTCDMDQKSSLFRLPVAGLTNATAIQVVFTDMPELSLIIEGSVTVVLNGTLTRKFTISRQVSRNQIAMVNDVQPQMIQWLNPE